MKQSVRIGINGLFWGKPHTGTGRYFRAILLHLCTHFPETEFRIYIPSNLYNRTDIQNLIRHYSNLSLVPIDVPLYTRDDQLWKYLWERILLPRAAQKDRVDIFWTPYHSAGRFRDIPHIMTVHDVIHHTDPRYVFNRRRAWYMRQTDLAARTADHIITVSKTSKADITHYLDIPSERITVIPHGPPELSNTVPNPPVSYPYILYVGGFDVRKNVPTLLQSFANLRKHNPELTSKLILPGDLPDSPLISPILTEIDRLNLHEHVYFPGIISEQELAAYLYGAQVLVYPSLYEGFGLPILEAMQAGTPVITSQFGAMAEVAGNAAELTDTRSSETLTTSLKNVLSDSTYQAELSQRGLERVKDFNWDRAGQATAELLQTYLD